MQQNYVSLFAALLTICVLGACSLDAKQKHAEEEQNRRNVLDSMVSGDKSPDSFDTGLSLLTHMEELALQGKFSEVERLLPKVEAIPDSALLEPPRVPVPNTIVMQLELPSIMDNLATVLSKHHQYALSERLLQKALAGSKTLAGRGDSTTTTEALTRHLLEVRAAQGKFDPSSYVQEMVSTGGSAQMALSQMGEVYLSQGKYVEAENAFRQKYDTAKSEPFPPYGRMDALRGLGKACYMQGKYAESCDKYGELVSLVKQMSAWQNTPHLIPDFTNCAKALRKAGRNTEADAAERDRATFWGWQQASTRADTKGVYDLD